MDITNYYEPFFEFLKNVRGYSPQTIKSYKITLNSLKDNHEIEKIDGKTILNIMPLRIKLKNHSKRSILAKLSAVRSFVEYLKTQHNIDIKLKNAQSIKAPKTLPKPVEQNSIYEVIENSDIEIRVLVKTLYGLGLRISELANLELKDISTEWIRVTGKGNKTREIPLLESLAKEIKEYINLKSPQKYLFEKNGKKLSDAQLRYKLEKAFKNLGIKATPHQLRHSFASHLLAKGARISDVSELLGHSSMATTQIYTKLTNSTKMQNYLKAHPLANE
jgi:integrase/recombinase XerC